MSLSYHGRSDNQQEIKKTHFCNHERIVLSELRALWLAVYFLRLLARARAHTRTHSYLKDSARYRLTLWIVNTHPTASSSVIWAYIIIIVNIHWLSMVRTGSNRKCDQFPWFDPVSSRSCLLPIKFSTEYCLPFCRLLLYVSKWVQNDCECL